MPTDQGSQLLFYRGDAEVLCILLIIQLKIYISINTEQQYPYAQHL